MEDNNETFVRRAHAMADLKNDTINFDKLEKELYAAVEAESRYWVENDAKIRAVTNKVATYDEFRDIVKASHLKPLEKKDKIPGKFMQPWNTAAFKVDEDTSRSQTTNISLQMPSVLPKNGHEFTRDWRRYCRTSSDRYVFLLHIGAAKLAEIFRAEISFGLLGDIVESLVNYNEADVEDVIAILRSLAGTNRFGLSLQFLSTTEKDSCIQLFVELSEQIKDSDEELRVLQDIAKLYDVEV